MNSSSKKQIQRNYISFKHIFRIVFVIFCLYLMGDAFSRWDGFRLHSSFSEFLPSVALALIIWTALGLCAAVATWFLLNALLWAANGTSRQMKPEHLFVNTMLFILLGALLWIGKKYYFPFVNTTIQVKLSVLFITLAASIFITFIFRDKSMLWMNTFQERMTPLVWLFGIIFIISIPLTGYHLFLRGNNERAVQDESDHVNESKDRPNIIFISFDSLTGRNMSVYGYNRLTTPFISKWAEHATVFTNLQAESNWTPPTTASMMTGKRVWTHGAYQSGVKVRATNENLASELGRYGYYNIAIMQNQIAHPAKMGIEESFDIDPKYTSFIRPTTLIGWSYGTLDVLFYRIFGEKFKLFNWMISRDFILGEILFHFSGDLSQTPFPPDIAFNKLLNLIDDKPNKLLFAWVHMMPPHDIYLPPEPFMGMFEPSQELRVYPGKVIPIIQSDEFQREHVNVLRARYDEYIRYCDSQFEEFIRALEERKLNNTVIILTSDHGESFEHDYYAHGGEHLYEQVTHVPFIIKEPQQTEGKVINDLVEQIDIPATILELSGIEPPSWMEGRSLVLAMRDGKLPARNAFAMNLDKNSVSESIEKGTVAVWEGEYKLIHYLDKNISLLFNLKNDPEEKNNLIDVESEVGEHLLALIQSELEKVNTEFHSGD